MNIKTILHLEIQYVGHPDNLFTFHNLFQVKGEKWTFQVSVHRPIVEFVDLILMSHVDLLGCPAGGLQKLETI